MASYPKNEWGLTVQQSKFCEEYVANGYNATQAYMASYNATYETANKNAWKILKMDAAQNYIVHIQKDRVKALNISAERILEELSTIAFAEKSDQIYTVTAKLKALDLLQKQLGVQTQKINANVDSTIEINVQVGE